MREKWTAEVPRQPPILVCWITIVSLIWLESLLRARIEDRRRGTEAETLAACS